MLAGQQYDARKNIDLPFTQQDLPYSGDGERVTGDETDPGTDITPKDANQATVRQFDLTAILAALSGIYYSWFSYTDISLPDVLTGITVTFNLSFGNGASSHPASQASAAFVGGGSISMSPHATGQASAALLPAIQPAITQVWSRGIPTSNFAFYTAGTATEEQILARVTQLMVAVGTLTQTTVTISNASPGVVTWTAHGLVANQAVLLYTSSALPSPLVTTQVYYVKTVLTANTFTLSLLPGGTVINTTTAGSGTQKSLASVQPLPVFKPKFYTFLLQGQQASIAASADTNAQFNSNADATSTAASYNYGNGFSREFGVTNRTERVGPVINGPISISGTSSSQAISSTVEASTPAFVLNGSTTVVNAITNAPSATTATVSGSVSPTSLTATTPAAIPTSGYYLVTINSNVDDYGLQFMHAGVVNFAVFA